MTDGSNIVITGVGLLTPIGDSAAATWASLLEGAAIVDHARAMMARGEQSALDRLIDLGEAVAREAIGHGNPPADDRTAFVLGTSKGPADDWLLPIDPHSRPTSDKPSNPKCEDVTPRPFIWSVARCEDVTSGPFIRSLGQCEDVTFTPFIGDSTTCEDVTSDPDIRFIGERPITDYGLAGVQTALARKLGLAGPQLTCSAACASSLHALIRAAMLLQHDDADRAIVIGVESSLHPAFIESFKRLGVIAKPGQPVRPFDQGRTGFLLAEAAAAIVLERRPAKPGEIVLDGFAIGADASHLTHTDAGAVTLRRCLTKVIAARPVDLIHAHATGTVANDPIELAAIEHATAPPGRENGRRMDLPILYSHKGSIGHTLGASGLVATVLNVLAHRHGVVPGNVNTIEPLKTTAGVIDRQLIRRPIRRSIAIAAGFGGATGVVGLRTAD